MAASLRSSAVAAAGTAIDATLGMLPKGLRVPLISAFNEVSRNFREGRWEPSELNGGKLCEVAYTIARGYVDGSYPANPSKPRDMVAACRSLESSPNTAPRSIRIQIPRMIIALYEIRNNRNVGHVGGDVDPNHMDASAVLTMSKWLMAEMVRFFHQVDTATASGTVDSLVEREVPLVWHVAGKRRVLDRNLSKKAQALVLIYSHTGPVNAETLRDWMEVPVDQARYFRRDVLRALHRVKMLEYDEATGEVHLSPLGIREVEARLTGALIAPA